LEYTDRTALRNDVAEPVCYAARTLVFPAQLHISDAAHRAQRVLGCSVPYDSAGKNSYSLILITKGGDVLEVIQLR